MKTIILTLTLTISFLSYSQTSNSYVSVDFEGAYSGIGCHKLGLNFGFGRKFGQRGYLGLSTGYATMYHKTDRARVNAPSVGFDGRLELASDQSTSFSIFQSTSLALPVSANYITTLEGAESDIELEQNQLFIAPEICIGVETEFQQLIYIRLYYLKRKLGANFPNADLNQPFDLIGLRLGVRLY